MVVLISENSNSSKWVTTEIGAALSYSSEKSSFGLIPVVLGTPEIPETIKHKLYLKSIDSNIDEIAPQILESISKLLGKREALKEKSEKLRDSTDAYINKLIDDLELKQKSTKNVYYAWNIIGFLTLVVSTAFLLFRFTDVSVNLESISLIVSLVKTALILSFLVACSRYSFLLGKIALDESMTLGERIHAISFGKVFIQMFSDDFTKEEMYKVFENWNVSPTSVTDKYKTEEYDPNLIKVVTDLIKVVKK
jgi:hypothetical protein